MVVGCSGFLLVVWGAGWVVCIGVRLVVLVVVVVVVVVALLGGQGQLSMSGVRGPLAQPSQLQWCGVLRHWQGDQPLGLAALRQQVALRVEVGEPVAVG